MAYTRKGTDSLYTNVPTRNGWVARTIGTRQRAMAQAVERMLVDLGPKGKRAWDLLEAVTAGTMTLLELHDAYRVGELDSLRQTLNDVDLTTHIEDWQQDVANRTAPDTGRHYLYHVRTLMPEGEPFWRSALTPVMLISWLNKLGVNRSTKRKYYAAAKSFFKYLRVAGVLSNNPLAEVELPKQNPPRTHALTAAEAKLVADAAEGEYRQIFALLYGTGLEITPTLALRRRDVDTQKREIRGRGTKSASRDRVLQVAEWAWPYVEEAIKDKLPNAPLFTLNDRSKASKVHKRVCESLGFEGYRLHDARHSWAVRQVKAGTPAELIARQLGHVNATMVVKVYGRFIPTSEERARWEARATQLDQDAVG